MSQQTEMAIAAMPTAPTRVSEEPRASAYRFFAILTFLISAGGLFLGLISRWVPFLTHGAIFAASSGSLSGSLMGYWIEYVTGLFANGFGGFMGAIRSIFASLNMARIWEFIFNIILVLSVVLSFALMITACLSRRAAKNCAISSMAITVLAYGGMSAVNYGLARQFAQPNMFDIPTILCAGIVLVFLFLTALARRKMLGIFNLLLLALTVLPTFALFTPNSPLQRLAMFGTLAIGENPFFGISALALLIVLTFNFIVSVCRVTAKEAYIFDTIRFGLLLVTVVLGVISVGLMDSWLLFQGNMLPAIFMLAAPLVAFVLSLAIAIIQIKRNTRTEIEETVRQIDMREAQRSQPKVQMQSPAMTAQSASPTLYSPQPVPMALYPMPYYIPPQQVAPQPAPEKPAPEQPMTEFEKHMAALAQEPSVESKPAPAANASAQPAPAVAPPRMGRSRSLQAAIAAQTATPPAPGTTPSFSYDATQYTYDPFLNGLSLQEKNEFGDLFIANKYGDLSYLPAYVVGSDNNEFFSKVFIYFSRFRSHISAALLDKLYHYVNRQ